MHHRAPERSKLSLSPTEPPNCSHENRFLVPSSDFCLGGFAVGAGVHGDKHRLDAPHPSCFFWALPRWRCDAGFVVTPTAHLGCRLWCRSGVFLRRTCSALCFSTEAGQFSKYCPCCWRAVSVDGVIIRALCCVCQTCPASGQAPGVGTHHVVGDTTTI